MLLHTHGYQNYCSFENVLQKFDLDKDGKCYNGDMGVEIPFIEIYCYNESFIDYNLMEVIKQPFKKDLNYLLIVRAYIVKLKGQ